MAEQGMFERDAPRKGSTSPVPAGGGGESAQGRVRPAPRRYTVSLRRRTVPPTTSAAEMISRFLMMYCPSIVGA